MSLFAPLERVFEIAAYRGFHAGLHRFLEDLDSAEPAPNVNIPHTLATNKAVVNDAKVELPPLTDFVKRLRSSGDSQSGDKNSSASSTRKPRKRQNNGQLG